MKWVEIQSIKTNGENDCLSFLSFWLVIMLYFDWSWINGIRNWVWILQAVWSGTNQKPGFRSASFLGNTMLIFLYYISSFYGLHILVEQNILAQYTSWAEIDSNVFNKDIYVSFLKLFQFINFIGLHIVQDDSIIICDKISIMQVICVEEFI